MGDLFHILVRIFPEHKFSDQDILKRYVGFYGDERTYALHGGTKPQRDNCRLLLFYQARQA